MEQTITSQLIQDVLQTNYRCKSSQVAVQMADACREADKVKLIIKLKSNSNRAFQDIIYKKIIIDTRIYTQTQVAQ